MWQYRFCTVPESIGIPFAGCNVLASANGMDKITMKQILNSCDIPVVPYIWFTDNQWNAGKDEIIEKIENKLGYPVIVKPANLGSSVGIGRAANRQDLITKIDEAEKYSARLLVEHMVDNLQEINCSVLGDVDDYRMSVLEEPIKAKYFRMKTSIWVAQKGRKVCSRLKKESLPTFLRKLQNVYSFLPEKHSVCFHVMG